MIRAAFHFFLSLSTAILSLPVEAKPLSVSLLMSDSTAPYRQFADSFSRNLAARETGSEITETVNVTSKKADLIVAVGMKAAMLAVTQVDTPVLVAMVPEAGYRELQAQTSSQKTGRMISVIYLDQPISRRLNFLRAALPAVKRVGLLHTPDSPVDIESIRREAAKFEMKLFSQQYSPDDRLFEVLNNVLTESDILFAVQDSSIYSSSNIRNILLTSYRHNVPLAGISKAYVTAGALCAIFSTPEQQASQAADTAAKFSRAGILPAPQYPADFTIEVNLQVARSLGISWPPEQVIRDRMSRNERKTP